MEIEWDPRKVAAHQRKQGIQFADAVPVLEDESAITIRDDLQGEERWVTIRRDAWTRILTLVYTWRTNTIRVISARPSTPNAGTTTAPRLPLLKPILVGNLSHPGSPPLGCGLLRRLVNPAKPVMHERKLGMVDPGETNHQRFAG